MTMTEETERAEVEGWREGLDALHARRNCHCSTMRDSATGASTVSTD
jgi:hypothetical protein